MASPNTGSGMIFNGAATVGGVVTPPVASRNFYMASFQTKSDGTQTLTVDIQVSNVPALRDGYAGATGPNPAAPVRDDSYASTDWVTVSTNTMTAVAQSRIDTVAYMSHRVSRVRLTSGAGTPNVKVFVDEQGNS
jgi:hypothetical protein